MSTRSKWRTFSSTIALYGTTKTALACAPPSSSRCSISISATSVFPPLVGAVYTRVGPVVQDAGLRQRRRLPLEELADALLLVVCHHLLAPHVEAHVPRSEGGASGRLCRSVRAAGGRGGLRPRGRSRRPGGLHLRELGRGWLRWLRWCWCRQGLRWRRSRCGLELWPRTLAEEGAWRLAHAPRASSVGLAIWTLRPSGGGVGGLVWVGGPLNKAARWGSLGRAEAKRHG